MPVTDEELDATESIGNLAHHLRRMADNIACDQIDADRLNRAADALTALRSQLAEVQAERDQLQRLANGQDYQLEIQGNILIKLNGRCIEQSDRADRIEAVPASSAR